MKLTARNAVSFQTALSNKRFALVPRKIGEVGIASIRFWSSKTLLLPLESGLYRDREDPLRSYSLVMLRRKRRFSITRTSIFDSFPPLICFDVTWKWTTNQPTEIHTKRWYSDLKILWNFASKHITRILQVSIPIQSNHTISQFNKFWKIKESDQNCIHYHSLHILEKWNHHSNGKPKII